MEECEDQHEGAGYFTHSCVIRGEEIFPPTVYRLLSKFDSILLNPILVDGRGAKSVCTDLPDIQLQILVILQLELLAA